MDATLALQRLEGAALGKLEQPGAGKPGSALFTQLFRPGLAYPSLQEEHQQEPILERLRRFRALLQPRQVLLFSVFLVNTILNNGQSNWLEAGCSCGNGSREVDTHSP